MTIDEAVKKLEERLCEPDVFSVSHDGTTIIVRVHFVYRIDYVRSLNGVWEVFPVKWDKSVSGRS